jgi:peptide/nickel transport system substrate-binding protein
MMNLRKSFLPLFVLLFVLTACTPPPPPPPTPQPTLPPPFTEDGPSLPTGPGALWIGWLNGPDNPNPFLAEWSESYTIFDLVYSSFYRLHPDGTIVPDLVASVSASANQTVWTFTLREGVTFHDGRPLTARDAAFSFNLYGTFTEVLALDETTVEIRLSKPIPNMEGHLLNLYVLPQHIWGRYENSMGAFDNLEMVGSGPFQMEAFAPESFIHLSAVPEHYASPPQLEDVVFLVFPDEENLKEGLRGGDIQLIYTLPILEAETLADDPNIEVATGQPLYPEFDELVFNQMPPENCPNPEESLSEAPAENLLPQPCSGHPALRDRTVRLAIAHAVNKPALVEQVLHGRGNPGVSLIPASLSAYFDPNLQDYAFDAALANQLLDEAGYLDTDGDGVREMPAESEEPGRPLLFRLDYPGPSARYAATAEQLAHMWQEIGLALTIRELDAETMTFLCCPLFDYDLLLWGWGVEPEPGDIFDLFESDEISTGDNESGFSDPDYDILNAVQHTETNPDKRLRVLHRMQNILHTDVTLLVLFYPETVAAYRTDTFTGWLTETQHLALESVDALVKLEPSQK